MSSNNIPNKFEKKMMLDSTSVRELLITALAEMLGTAILLLLGCMGCLGGLTSVPPHLQITLNFGLTVMLVIQCFGHISAAHINPAMTVGAVVLGKKTIREGLVYFVAQAFGAILGFGLLKVVTPVDYLRASPNASLDSFCVTDLHENVHAIQGLLIEGVSTAILMLIACAAWDSRNAHNADSVAIKFGLAVTALATSVGPYTGCSMNPVRTFAPALWNNYWTNHWIYWFGPLGGALLASLAYKALFSPKDEEIDTPESVALNSVDSRKAEHM
ncbi:aquaporin AQPcic-like [Copidosoma floridanum]|uniref:aquaporin AQPcic-like n=1 Tax=Copidosoma floridanum TaxID=29053 RepID=UPI0006C9422F|nr:aquaporin AQPcic-like [Copidosoma floridanum]